MTRPQFKMCLYAKSIYPMHCSHNSSHAHRYFLHPHFKMQAKDTTQADTQSVVCLSGLELTVKHTQTPFHFFGIYLLFTLYRTQPEQCLSNPNYRRGSVGSLLLLFLSFLSPRYPYKEPANRHLVMELKCK